MAGLLSVARAPAPAPTRGPAHIGSARTPTRRDVTRSGSPLGVAVISRGSTSAVDHVALPLDGIRSDLPLVGGGVLLTLSESPSVIAGPAGPIPPGPVGSARTDPARSPPP